MQKFYYTAVSNSAKKKIIGSISAEDERMARAKLNKIGMSILAIAPQEIPDWDEGKAFEFSVIQKNDDEFVGQMLAENDVEIFDRLASEFKLKKINYVYRVGASEEEKIRAREKSVQKIIEHKEEEEKTKEEKEMRTLSGGLKSLMGKHDAEKHRLEDLKKFSGQGQGAAVSPVADEKDDLNAPDEGVKKIVFQKKATEADAALSEAAQKNPIIRLRNKIKAFIDFFPLAFQRAKRVYFLVTELIVPPSGKTRGDAWNELKLFLFPPVPPKDHEKIAKQKSEKALNRRAVMERFWISLEEIFDVLAAVFLAYLSIGVLGLYVEIPHISELAHQTLDSNLMMYFLAGAFIFVRFLIWLREKFTSWSPLRTSLLFFAGGMAIVVVGMNIL